MRPRERAIDTGSAIDHRIEDDDTLWRADGVDDDALPSQHLGDRAPGSARPRSGIVDGRARDDEHGTQDRGSAG
ncbi:MAG: hypothetical protein R2710_12810 [Acidimicrobiales bacterium]